MGKRAVLKDLTSRPAGYVIQSDEDVICRAELAAAAELTLVFADGSRITYALDSGCMEQRFCGEGKTMCGCYVFRGKELLMISEDAMRSAFERHVLMGQKRALVQDKRAKNPENERLSSRVDLPKRECDREAQRLPAQRRWPPPPCWETARYLKGCWQEE